MEDWNRAYSLFLVSALLGVWTKYWVVKVRPWKYGVLEGEDVIVWEDIRALNETGIHPTKKLVISVVSNIRSDKIRNKGCKLGVKWEAATLGVWNGSCNMGVWNGSKPPDTWGYEVGESRDRWQCNASLSGNLWVVPCSTDCSCTYLQTPIGNFLGVCRVTTSSVIWVVANLVVLEEDTICKTNSHRLNLRSTSFIIKLIDWSYLNLTNLQTVRM